MASDSVVVSDLALRTSAYLRIASIAIASYEYVELLGLLVVPNWNPALSRLCHQHCAFTESSYTPRGSCENRIYIPLIHSSLQVRLSTLLFGVLQSVDVLSPDV